MLSVFLVGRWEERNVKSGAMETWNVFSMLFRGSCRGRRDMHEQWRVSEGIPSN